MNALLTIAFLITILADGVLSQWDEEPKRKERKHKRTISAILRARDNDDHYGVLGLRNNRYLRTPARSLTIIPKYLQVHIPELTLFYVSKKQIKKAFRQRALSVHPDKTTDSRADEAFNAIDKAAEILLDDNAREEYDRSITLGRKKRRAEISGKLKSTAKLAQTCLTRLNAVLGPFTVPVVVMSFLFF